MSFFNKVITTVFGKKSDKDLKKLNPFINEINDEYIKLDNLSNDELRDIFENIKDKLGSTIQDYKDKYEGSDLDNELKKIEQQFLDDHMVKVFAIVKDAARRLKGKKFKVMGTEMIWDMVHYDVQLVGGIVLHQGKISEMKTGEGKTLVSTLSIVLNAITGRGCML